MLMLDFRCFGGSEGEPRHHVDPRRQVEDYLSALDFAEHSLAKEGIVDPARMALWGSSFSGGCAIVAATTSNRAAALVAQSPFVETPEEQKPTRLAMARYLLWTTLDQVRPGLGPALGLRLEPVYIAAFGQPGEFVLGRNSDLRAAFLARHLEIAS